MKYILISILLITNMYGGLGGEHSSGTIDPSKITINTTPPTVPANDYSMATITVYLADYEDVAVTNATFSLYKNDPETNLDSDSEFVGIMTNHHNGYYSIQVKSSVVEVAHYHFNATALDIAGELHTVSTGHATVTFVPAGLPDGVTLYGGKVKYITSIYDMDYAPYTRQFTAASLNRPVPADYQTDRLIDIQGKITVGGVNIDIPYSADYGVTIPAYKSAYNVPAAYTEDGTPRRVYLEYNAQYIHGDGVIHARIHSVGGRLLAKKLDINVGIGDGSDRILVNSDTGERKSVYGVKLANFPMAVNGYGDVAEIQARIMVGIPDKKFGQIGHMHLYLPITDSHGNEWLNNNIGAEYANLNSNSFNLAKQGTSKTDSKAYGSRQNYAQAKNSCPVGWRLPTVSEYKDTVQLPFGWGVYAYTTNPFAAANSRLKLGNSGYTIGHHNYVYGSGYYGNYWTSQTGACNTAYALHINACVVKIHPWSQILGLSTRCIKE